MAKLRYRLILAGVLLLAAWPVHDAAAQVLDHPVFTELLTEPPGLGGPVGRDPLDPHQEFIEIYLPPLANLAAGLDADALRLTIYDVEGDSTSPGLAQVNYRIDLPTFDLDPSNGLTGLPRPPTGIVVLGWVDYVGNPATDLAGTPSTRIALINGGITSTADFIFVAINGAHFSGTTNFPSPVAISFLDTVIAPVLGKIEQGSGALLLVDRDDPGYVEYCGLSDPTPGCSVFPNLPGGTGLGLSSLLDAFAPNDDSKFKVGKQPYAAPTGDNIDLEFVLPLGGVFSVWTPQIPEEADGYQRLFVDVLKTTEDGIAANEDPVSDAKSAYRSVVSQGPFLPTPGRAPATTSGAALSVASPILQQFQILTNTSSRPGIFAANTGGNHGLVTVTSPGPSGNPSLMTIQADTSSFTAIGQAKIGPAVAVTTFATTPAGHAETVAVQIAASVAMVGDPPVIDPNWTVDATFTAIDPTVGLDALGMPFQATALLAVHGLPDDPLVANEFAGTSLGLWMAAGLGTFVFDSLGNGAALIDPLTDLSDPLVVDPMVAEIPSDPLNYINPVGATGTLVAKVQGSAEVLSGALTYENSFNLAGTLVQARGFPITPVATSGSGFTPTERIHYSNPKGLAGDQNSGLTDVLTGRDFELALIETNLGPLGFLETGATDDFGLVVEAATTSAGSPIVPGEFIMLSFTGGLEGADIDTLAVPPGGIFTNIIYVDLDPLDTVLGVESISRVFVVDGSGNGEIDILDVIAVPEPGSIPSLLCGIGLISWINRRCRSRHST